MTVISSLIPLSGNCFIAAAAIDENYKNGTSGSSHCLNADIVCGISLALDALPASYHCAGHSLLLIVHESCKLIVLSVGEVSFLYKSLCLLIRRRVYTLSLFGCFMCQLAIVIRADKKCQKQGLGSKLSTL